MESPGRLRTRAFLYAFVFIGMQETTEMERSVAVCQWQAFSNDRSGAETSRCYLHSQESLSALIDRKRNGLNARESLKMEGTEKVWFFVKRIGLFLNGKSYNKRKDNGDFRMLRDHSQMTLSLSPYQGIYDVIIPANHLLRRIKENIDFSFVNPM
ncbi:MAG: hypothetical protein LIO92_00480 [Clostridiales bacterium]|nr:hypothetical protein [Clostridiales bacterium]